MAMNDLHDLPDGRDMGQGTIGIHVSARRTGDVVSCLFKGALGQIRVDLPLEYDWLWNEPVDMEIAAVAAVEALHSQPYFEAAYTGREQVYLFRRYADESTKGDRYEGTVEEWADAQENVLWVRDGVANDD